MRRQDTVTFKKGMTYQLDACYDYLSALTRYAEDAYDQDDGFNVDGKGDSGETLRFKKTVKISTQVTVTE